MRFSLCSAAVMTVSGLFASVAFGQVRLGPQGPYTPARNASSGGSAAAPDAADGSGLPGASDSNPATKGGVRLGPNGPYQPRRSGSTEPPSKGVQPIVAPVDSNRPETFKIAITPAAEPELPLKYALLPKYEDVRPGNSVPFYYRAVLNWKDRPKESTKPFHDNYDRWISSPLSRFPTRDVKQFLKGYTVLFDELKTAAQRERTEWSWRLKDLQGLKSIAFLLPEIQESRQLARLLYLKSRVEIAEGRYADAIETLQIGNKLARDVAKPPTLINNLVGIAIASMMAENVREMIGSPDSPNLYWALSKLPRPFIDMEPALNYEMSVPMKLFPTLKDAETAEHSPEEWSRLLGNALLKLNDLNGPAGAWPRQRLTAQLSVAGLALMGYPRAKRDLVKWGYAAKKVDGMPVGQVIAIHQARTYRYMYQEMMKWSNLPYHQALEGASRSEQKLKDERYFAPAGRGREIIPLAALLLPAVWQAQRAGARIDSRIAGLQALEAIRMYAANHKGKLPESLSEIRAVPVPLNPITGQPFPYHFAAGKAVLEIPAPSGQPARVGWRFEISVRSKP